MQKNLMWLENKVIFVTWWTSGIGRATVLSAATNGAKVAFVGLSKEQWDSIAQELWMMWLEEDNVFFMQCDITDFDALAWVIEKIIAKRWRIDGVFCCAGAHIVGDILSTTLEQWNYLRNLNTTSIFMTMKYVLPYMIQQKSWRIVLMASDQALIGKAKSSVYGATKAAIAQLAKSSAIDYAPHNICVNAVCPWTINTPQAERAAKAFAEEKFGWDIQKARDDFAQAQPIKRLGTPEEVANLVCFLLTDQASYMTGSIISIDGWYVAV